MTCDKTVFDGELMYSSTFLSLLSRMYPGKSVMLESRHISTSDCTFRSRVVDLSPVTMRDGQLHSIVVFLLGDSPASEFYAPTFRNTLFHLHR